MTPLQTRQDPTASWFEGVGRPQAWLDPGINMVFNPCSLCTGFVFKQNLLVGNASFLVTAPQILGWIG